MKQLNEQINTKYVIQAKKLDRYNHILRKILPIECLEHVTVAGFGNQTLTLLSDSPVWTTRLRQLSPTILAFLRENREVCNSPNAQQPVFHHINIKTRYNSAASQAEIASRKVQRARPEISQKTAEILSQSADSIEDPKLKESLKKLARHTADGSSN